MMRSTFSTTTMASSTRMPMASTMPNMVSTFTRETGEQHHRHRAHQGDRHDDGRDEGVADVLQEQEHHDEHQHHRLDQGHHDLLDRGLHGGGDVVGDVPLEARREELGQLLHLGADGARRLQRVAVGGQGDRDAGGLAAVQAGRELVGVAAEFDPGDVAQAHVRAVGIGAQHDGAEIVHGAELALDDDRREGRVIDRARLAPTAPEAIWMFWLRIASVTSSGVSERPRSLSGSIQTRRERSVE